ncbi:MAG TPA: hypothetical protein VGL72_04765 [Bryobacteraceae bacterium]|jgi:hypothetical protein
MNTTTLVATFKEYSSARQAARELENIGIPSESIHVDSIQKTARAGSVEYQSGPAEEQLAYGSTVASANAILRASVADDVVDSAMEVFNRNGAIHVDRGGIDRDEMDREKVGRGTRTAQSPLNLSDIPPTPKTGGPIRARSRKKPAQGMSPNMPAPSVMSGFGTTPGTGTLAGESTTRSSEQEFTPEYRDSFEQKSGTGAGFEAMRPAYDYGSRIAADARYRGRTWDEIENDLRAAYERDYPDSPWETSRDAVHQGWEKVSRQRQG